MNILIPASWLSDFLKTRAPVEEIARYLSLCSQSVERIRPVDDGDKILEIEITSNRPDCLSVIGIAREANAALISNGFSSSFLPPKKEKTNLAPLPKLPLRVSINPPAICPRFCALLIEKVNVGPSPKIIQQRLEKVGLRAIDNVVDVSNYLMIETGQPIHTFDYDKILGQKMAMRLSRKGETVKTLDGVTRKLPGGDIVIEDGKGRLIDLCGIMGAENSAIDKNTRRVLFFVQAYNPVLIRRTSMLLGHRTEAAMRFERGIDLEAIPEVVFRGAKMIAQNAGGKITSRLIDIYPQKKSPKIVPLNFARAAKIINAPISAEKMINSLALLEFNLQKKTKEKATFLVPSFRSDDISCQEDLVEEIARLYGYFNLKSILPPLPENLTPPPGKADPQRKGKFEPLFLWEKKVKTYLCHQGLWESFSYSFISQELINKSNIKKTLLRLKNPISAEFEYLQNSLLPSLLQTFSQNQAHFPTVSFFELANVYLPKPKNLPEEKRQLAVLSPEKDILKAKGIVEGLFWELGIKNYSFTPKKIEESFWSEKKDGTQIIVNQKKIGFLGFINEEILNNFQIKTPLVSFVLDFESLAQQATTAKAYSPISLFPPIIEDLTFSFPEKTYLGPVISAIKAASSLVKKAEITSVFGNRRTFRLTYQHPRRNLNAGEVKKLRKKIIENLEEKFSAEAVV
ncbi:phenylalanine--tRNA ligase subunit beta [Candidatus Shapirobacteria bacterium]|nr:phenylalanine--tRNA ligase subunit beta [Candidatus Shapirobacteria bacterium]